MGVTQQALSERQRVNNQGQSVNQRVPAVSLTIFDSHKIALRPALIAQWSQPLQLRQSHPPARRSEIAQVRLIDQLLIERN